MIHNYNKRIAETIREYQSQLTALYHQITLLSVKWVHLQLHMAGNF